jgi:hypothetical protein
VLRGHWRQRLWRDPFDPKKTHGRILFADIYSLLESRRTEQRLHFVEALELNNYVARSRGCAFHRDGFTTAYEEFPAGFHMRAKNVAFDKFI